MRKAEVIVGQIYHAKVSGKVVPVRIELQKDCTLSGRTHWRAKNLKTERWLTIKSAGRLTKLPWKA